MKIPVGAYNKQMKILNLSQIGELKVRKNNELLLFQQNSICFCSSLDNIVEPVDVSKLLLKHLLLVNLIRLCRLFIKLQILQSVLGFMLFCDGVNGLYFVFSLHLHVESRVDIILKHFMHISKRVLLLIWHFGIHHHDCFAFLAIHLPYSDHPLLCRICAQHLFELELNRIEHLRLHTSIFLLIQIQVYHIIIQTILLSRLSLLMRLSNLLRFTDSLR